METGGSKQHALVKVARAGGNWVDGLTITVARVLRVRVTVGVFKTRLAYCPRDALKAATTDAVGGARVPIAKAADANTAARGIIVAVHPGKSGGGRHQTRASSCTKNSA